MLATITQYRGPVPARAVGRRVRARVRPLLGRAAQRRADRGVLDRLRSRAVRLERPARHALEVQRRPARRLRQDARRRRCRQRRRSTSRHAAEPGQLPRQERLAAHGDRRRRPDGQFRSSRSWRWRCCSPSAGRSPRRRSARCSRTARRRRPGCCRATGSPRSTASRSPASRTCSSVVRVNPGLPLPCRSSATARRWMSRHARRPARTDRFGNARQVGRIGVSRPGVEYRRSDPFLAPFEARRETGRMIGGTLQAIGR